MSCRCDGIVGIVVDDVCVALAAANGCGNKGLHGECDPAEVLDDAAIGTPVDEYRSWLNWNYTSNSNVLIIKLIINITRAECKCKTLQLPFQCDQKGILSSHSMANISRLGKWLPLFIIIYLFNHQ